MSSSGINFGGMASGLDTGAIIAALMAVERRPIQALQAKKTSLNQQKNLFGDFRGLLDELQEAAKALRTTTDFLQMQAASSDDDVLTANAGNSATPGSHTVEVVALATAQIHASLGKADKDVTDYGDGTIFINVGGTDHAVSFGSGTGFSGTLEGIAQAIRSQDLDVTADVVDTGQTGSARYQLVLRSRTAGTEGAFTLSLDTGTAQMQALVDEINGNAVSAAQNAHVKLDGIDIYRSTNSIGDAIAGVTLDLRSAPVGNRVTVTVTTDAEETSKKVKDFVDAYNKVVDFVAAQNTVAQDSEARKPLFGDSTLRSIRSSLRSIVGGAVTTGNQAIEMLVHAGITSDRDGRLTFDQSKFEEQLAVDEQAVARLFAGAGSGVAARLSDQIDVYTDSAEGLIKARTDGFDRLVRDTQRRIDQGEERLARYQTSLEARFASLESLLARLQGQGSALAGFPMMQPN
jgi:flagellar hook-associated protein 2